MSSFQGKRGRTSTPRSRVVLLLDLDCFYAQCETVRLGLDKSLPLCLLQWNSALAVNYPARAFGIKRGDGFNDISRKSKGRCVALHLPVISVEDENIGQSSGEAGTDHSTDAGGEGESSLEQSYDATYNLPQNVRAEVFEKERNVMRSPNEGKASLERYRLTSVRIFSVITEALVANVGKNNFILERASIDEIFLDVTDHCYDVSKPAWNQDIDHVTEAALNETFVFGASKDANIDEEGDDCDEEEIAAMRRGCVIARGVRKAVHDALSFTMSAGISINKTVAKLGATFGKPDGQAVVFPPSIPTLMDETPIRKVRNMGGKVGKQVKSLLPDGEEKMGSIAKLLSLPDLAQHIGRDAAQRVFNVARGIDDEPVLETKGALIKSITAFKSFGATNHEGIERWIRLLASDIVARVELDSKRNERHPRSCNIQYIYSDGGGRSDRTARSARIAFPRASGDRNQRLEELVAKVTKTLAKKNNFPIYRLGLSAIDFETQSHNGAIDAFFTKQVSPKKEKQEEEEGKVAEGSSESSSRDGFKRATETQSTSEMSTAKHSRGDVTPGFTSATAAASPSRQSAMMAKNEIVLDKDLEYARRLQASYDKEEALLSTFDRNNSGSSSGSKTRNFAASSSSLGRTSGTGGEKSKSKKKRSGSSSNGAIGSKKGKIDGFFFAKK